MDIILLENEGQSQDFVKKNKNGKTKKQIIALTPFAACVLENNGIHFKLIEDYYEPGDLYKYGVENYLKVERICSLIDRYIQEASPSLSEIDFKPSWYNYSSLKTLYDTLSIRAFQLTKLLEVENPEIVTVHDEEDPSSVGDNYDPLLFGFNEPIYIKLLKLPNWKCKFSYSEKICLPAIPVTESGSLKHKIILVLNRPSKLCVFLINRIIGRWLSTAMNVVNNKSSMYVFLGGGSEWLDSDKYLKERGIYCIDIPKHLKREFKVPFAQEMDVKGLTECWIKLQKNEEFKSLFRYGGVDFYPLLWERLKLLVENITPRLFYAYTEALKIIKRKRIKAVVLTTKYPAFLQAVSVAARDSGIPVITWQHAAYEHSESPMIPYSEMMNSDFHFVFGNNVAKGLTKAAKRFDVQVVPVGSESLNLLCKRDAELFETNKRNNKKIVFYPLGRYSQNHLYIAAPPPFSDNILFDIQREILSVLGLHKDYEVIAKIHPIYETPNLQRYTKDRGFKNIKFLKYECSVTDILPSADIVIVDTPSTSLFHTLTTQKPIFVYTRYNLREEAIQLLRRRAYCYESLGELKEALDNYLSGESIGEKVDLEDKEFLKAYGIHDGNCGEKAAELLDNIIHDYNGGRR